MNRMGPLILILATANALAGAAVAGAGAAVVVFIGIVAAGWLFFRNRGEAAESDTPRHPAAEANGVGRQAAEAIVIARQGAQLLVRVGGRDRLARPAAGSALPGYGDAVVIEGTEGDLLVVRMHARR
jgi:membrane protein implicated in regulation of membrane protease activity